MTQPAKMPLSAVGMIAAHLYLERMKQDDIIPRDLARMKYGTDGRTYGDGLRFEIAMEAWKIADAVEEAMIARCSDVDTMKRQLPNT